MREQHIISIEYKDLKVTIESNNQESTLSAFLVGASVIEETQKLGYVKPKLKIQIPIRKETRNH